ncbi:MAG: ABC transporter permease [Acidobacteriia bacterium]|nr:ABC transporter permease [Terriglobia bacterium]
MPRIQIIVRSLLRNPGLTLSAILALALGIGANTALFTVISSLALHPYPLPEANRLIAILEREPNDSWTRVAPADYFDLAHQSASFAAISAWRGSFSTLTDAGATDQIWSVAVTEQVLSLLGSQPVIGRSLQPEDFMPSAPQVALLSYREWIDRFAGNPAILGRTVSVGDGPYTVVGVMSKGFILPGYRRSDIFLPFRELEDDRMNRNDRNMYVCALLKPGVSVPQAGAELQGLTNRLRTQWPREVQGREIYAKPFRDYISEDNRAAFLTLLGASVFVLLIAAANVTSLLLARTTVRRHEIAIRRALGASNIQIAAHWLTESLIVALLGGLAGVLLAFAGIPLLLRLIPADTPIAGLDNVHLDIGVLAFAFAVTLIVAVLLGLMPALAASRMSLNQALHQAGRSSTLGRGGWRLLRSLTAIEVALALVLTAGAGLMISSLSNMLSTDRGFEADHVLTVQAPTASQKFQSEARQQQVYARLLERIEMIPGVRSAGFVNVLPLTGAEITTRIWVEGRAERNPVELRMYAVSPGYFRTMGIRLIDGRLFSNYDGNNVEPSPVLVNEVFARHYWPGESAVGKRIRQAGGGQENPWQVVIGVVGNTRHGTLNEAPSAALYYHYQRYIGPTFVATMVVRASGNPGDLARSVRQAIAATDPALSVSKVASMVEVIEDSLWQNRLSTVLLSLFAVLALTLAAIGIYGTLSYVVQQSLAEAGIRLALGATPARILRSTLRGAMAPALAGAFFGLLGALALTRFIAGYLYGITATDPWTLVASAVLLLAIALVAGIVPARRAAFVDPMVVLRHE